MRNKSNVSLLFVSSLHQFNFTDSPVSHSSPLFAFSALLISNQIFGIVLFLSKDISFFNSKLLSSLRLKQSNSPISFISKRGWSPLPAPLRWVQQDEDSAWSFFNLSWCSLLSVNSMNSRSPLYLSRRV